MFLSKAFSNMTTCRNSKHKDGVDRANSTAICRNGPQLSYISVSMPINQHKFNHDLTSTLHMCNNPSNKLDQQPFKDFIHKYTGYHVPPRKQISEIYTKTYLLLQLIK